MGIAIPGQDTVKAMELVDVPGHYNFRQRLREEYLPQAAIVILLVDSKDKDKFAQAADILYDVIGDSDVVSARVPVLVACNK